jgi:hypothetical protein
VVAQRGHGHLDVRHRRHAPDQGQVDAVVEAGGGEQQPGDDLRRLARVDLHRPAAHPAGSVHGERGATAAAVVHLDTECPQRREQAGVGAVAQPRVAVHGDGAVGQCGDRREEAQHRAGQPRVHRCRSAFGKTIQRSNFNHSLYLLLKQDW